MAIYRYDWDPPIKVAENYSVLEFAYQQAERKWKFSDIALVEGHHFDTPTNLQITQEHRISVFPSTEGEYAIIVDEIGTYPSSYDQTPSQHIGPDCPLIAITSDSEGEKFLHRVVIYEAQSNPGT